MPRSSKKVETTTTTNKAPANLKQAIAGITADLVGNNEVSIDGAQAIAESQVLSTRNRQASVITDAVHIGSLREKCRVAGAALDSNALSAKTGNATVLRVVKLAVIEAVGKIVIGSKGMPLLDTRTGRPMKLWTPELMAFIKDKCTMKRLYAINEMKPRNRSIDERALNAAITDVYNNERRRLQTMMKAQEDTVTREIQERARVAQAAEDAENGIVTVAPSKEVAAYEALLTRIAKKAADLTVQVQKLAQPDDYIGTVDGSHLGKIVMTAALTGMIDTVNGRKQAAFGADKAILFTDINPELQAKIAEDRAAGHDIPEAEIDALLAAAAE
jgi:hypothetical protein